MIKNTQPLKGFRDFLPEEALKRQWLRNRLCDIFQKWGYEPMETPTLEPLELFEGNIGEEEQLFYKFEDNGGRKVALRYDQTVPTSRVVAEYINQLPMPFRRYQIQSAYRAEKPQKGRYREFTQCDADIFGVASPLADAEVIALSLDIYRQLGFKEAVVKINDRSILKDNKIPYQAIVAIDKLEKVGSSGVIKDMESRGISNSQAVSYLNTVQQLQPNETISVILKYLKEMEFPTTWYRYDPTLSRSFSYSTGPIWEVVIPNFTSGSVLGGERYDQLIEKISGLNIPATGFGQGFDRTLEAADQFGLIPIRKTTTQILVTIFSPEFMENSTKTSCFIRESGINTELFPDPSTKLEKQIKYADKKGIPFVAIIGPDEAEKGLVTLKNLKTRDQQTIKQEELIKFLIP